MKTTLTRTFILRTAILGAFAFAGVGANAQTPNPQIIPAPKQLTVGEGKFKFGLDTRIVLGDPLSEEDRFAAQDFADDVKETAGVLLRLTKIGPRHSILIGAIGLRSIQDSLIGAAMGHGLSQLESPGVDRKSTRLNSSHT